MDFEGSKPNRRKISSEMAEANPISQKTCDLCGIKPSKYCCPRCSVIFCSLDCYKSEKHTECSEDFYRDCVNEEMASYQTDDDSKSKMIDILKNMQSEDNIVEDECVDSDDDIGLDLITRLETINIDDEFADDIWDALNDDEKNKFEAFLEHGDVTEIYPQWEPWWMYKEEKKLVEDANKKDAEWQKRCPELKKVPTLDSLTTVPPSPAVQYNIVNVICSYALMMRMFNGEDESVNLPLYFLNVCDNLAKNTNFENAPTALESVVQRCAQCELLEADEQLRDMIKHDAYRILQGPSVNKRKHYCKASLSHVYRILINAIKQAKVKNVIHLTQSDEAAPTTETREFSKKFPDRTFKDIPTLEISKIKLCAKKVKYYLSVLERYD